MMNTDTGYEKRYYFGIDIGGTSVKAAVFDESDNTVGTYEFATDKEDNGSHILNDVADFVSSWMNENGADASVIGGIGIGVPGAVLDDGTVNGCVNLGWGVVNVKAELERLTGIRTVAGNDANVAALGEYAGYYAGLSSFFFVTLGTGVGGGLIMNGRPVCGINGAAAEIGHLPIVTDEDRMCTCGKKGCLEQAASATGIVHEALKRLNSASDSSAAVSSLQKYDKAALTAKDVFDEAKAGDIVAGSVIDRAAEYLGRGIACVACAVNPECIVIGGGMAAAGEYFLDKVRASYRANVFYPMKDTPIVKAELGNDAGVYGAAHLVMPSSNNERK